MMMIFIHEKMCVFFHENLSWAEQVGTHTNHQIHLPNKSLTKYTQKTLRDSLPFIYNH